jgi:hypothetical protein
MLRGAGGRAGSRAQQELLPVARRAEGGFGAAEGRSFRRPLALPTRYVGMQKKVT